MEAVLKDYFGYTTFRNHQKEIISKIMEQRDCLVVMATGSGKSLCYQLPPLISKKVAVVISPLTSLMQDQVMGLKERGVRADYLGSAQSDSTVFSKAKAGEYSLLFMTPEKALKFDESFWSSLGCKGISLLAVDEAHCISEWGHDFRKEYQQLQKLRKYLPNTPFVAFTATATQRVRDDIKKSLQLRNPFEVVSTFDRPNIFYGVKCFNRNIAFREELSYEVMKDCKSGGSTIFYCTTIKDVLDVTQALVQAGADARSYHGQMNQKDREATHRAFARDELQIIVATVAFGMGIDKPDIRRVIHYGCPKSLESYYQESGRCGRDGLPSTCWLYYTRADFGKGDLYTAESASAARRKVVLDVYHAAEKYCKITSCRRKFILEYFGENVAYGNCGNCDNCTSLKRVEERDMSEEAHLLLSCVNLCGGRFGINVPIDVLRGSRSKKVTENGFDELPLHGLGSNRSANWWKSLGDQLISMGFLMETRRDFYRFISVSDKGKHFLQAVQEEIIPVLIVPTQEMIEEELKKGGMIEYAAAPGALPETVSKDPIQMLSEVESKLCELLLKERTILARENFTAPYAICSEGTIQNLAKLRPSNRARLLNVDGVNQWLVKKHGDEILGVIRRLSIDLGLSLDSVVERPPVLPHELSCAPKSTQGLEIKATPAKIEAWKMWQEMHTPIFEIANHPDRPKPIKEETVGGYIIECCMLGFALDWERFCNETGFSKEVVEEVKAGIERAGGARDKLKTIKEQVPDSVNYLHIRMYLAMEDLNLPVPTGSAKDVVELEEASSQSETKGACTSLMEEVNRENSMECAHHESHESKPPWVDKAISSYPCKRRRAPMWRNEVQEVEQERKSSPEDKSQDSAKSLKTPPRALSEESLIDWLSKHNGVSKDEILSAFSNEHVAPLCELLVKLEGDFLIYRKNDLYRVM